MPGAFLLDLRLLPLDLEPGRLPAFLVVLLGRVLPQLGHGLAGLLDRGVELGVADRVAAGHLATLQRLLLGLVLGGLVAVRVRGGRVGLEVGLGRVWLDLRLGSNVRRSGELLDVVRLRRGLVDGLPNLRRRRLLLDLRRRPVLLRRRRVVGDLLGLFGAGGLDAPAAQLGTRELVGPAGVSGVCVPGLPGLVHLGELAGPLGHLGSDPLVLRRTPRGPIALVLVDDRAGLGGR